MTIQAWFHKTTLEAARDRYLAALQEIYQAREQELLTVGIKRLRLPTFRTEVVKSLKDFIAWNPDCPKFNILKPHNIESKRAKMNEIIGIASQAADQTVMLDTKAMECFGDYLFVAADQPPRYIPL